MKRFASDAAATCPPWWGELHARCPAASLFTSPAWMETWLAVYGREFGGTWVHWESEGTVVAGCLLVSRVVRRRGVLRLRSCFVNATGEAAGRTPLAEFNDVLCLPGYEESVANELAGLLLEQAWDCLFLSGYEEGGVLDRLAKSIPAARVVRDPRPAPFVDLVALGEKPFESAISSNARGQVRRSRKLYEERSGALVLDRARTRDEAKSFFDELVRSHNARWQAKGERGSFEDPQVLDFHRRLLDRLWDEQAIDLLRLRSGDSEVGYLHNFRRNGKVYFFQSGFVYETDARFKPGLVTHELAIDHYRRAGEREYDFLAGDARYKRTLAKSFRTLHWTVVYRNAAWIRLLFALRDRMRSILPVRPVRGSEG